ncbi:MAG: hypothetical protein ACM3QY_05585 [Candidatus Levyibacteriota bacterium]
MPDASRHDDSATPEPRQQPDLRRRRFLMACGAGAAGAAAATPAVSNSAAIVAPTATQRDANGYRESDHIRSYYASTRL